MRRICWIGFCAVLLALQALLSAVPAGAADELTVYAYRDISKDWGKKGYWGVILRFNNPVFPSNLAEAVKVTVEGVSQKFEVWDRQGNEKASHPGNTFLLRPSTPPGKPVTVRITIPKGLSDVTGRRLLAKDYYYDFMSLQKIFVSGITTYHNSRTDKGLRLTLSDYVSEAELSPAVEIEPAVEDLTLTREGGWNYRISGKFEFNKDYVFKLSEATVNKGTAVLALKEFKFKGPGLKPEVTARTRRSVIELKSRQLLPINLSNVDKILCKMSKVPPLLFPEVLEALSTQKGAKKFNLEEKIQESQALAEVAKTHPVFAGEAGKDSEIFFAQPSNEKVYGYSLPLSFRKNPEYGGAWVVYLSDPDRSTHETKKLVQITDMAVSYKVSEETLLVWVTSIYNGDPISAAEVMVADDKSHRYFAGKTDANGILKIKNGDKLAALTTGSSAGPVDLSAVKYVVAATPTDSSMVVINTVPLKPFGVTQTANLKERPDAQPNGYVFTERGVYNPGETVHFKYVSRVYKDNKIVPADGERVKAEITGPTNDVVFSKNFTLGQFGSCWDSLPTKKFFPVGTYTINVKHTKQGGGEQTFSNTFQVQEFKKVRHYVTVTAKREEVPSTAYIGLKRNEEYLAVEVRGLYYTGGPVKNGRVRWKATLVPVVNKVKGLEGFFFGNEDEKTLFLESGESVLDGQGKLKLTIPLDSKQLTGINGVEISATVLDIDGEPATDVQTYNPRPRYLVGMSGHPRQVQTGYAAPLKVIVVDGEGRKVQAGSISAAILHKEYFDVQKRDDDGNMSYVWEEGWKKMFSSQQPVHNGEAVFQMEFNEGGDYLIAFTYEEKGERFTSQTIFQVGWEEYSRWLNSERDKSEAARNQILLSMSKKEYSVGDKVRVEFSFPRPVKKCLVTVERGKVIEAKVLDLKAALGAFEFTVKEEHLPNVFVSVLATTSREGFPVYASQADSDLPSVYFGYSDVSVRSEVQKLKLDIEPETAELKGRPAEEKSLSFKVTDHRGKGVVAEMAICVVDEAILALTRYKTPDLSSLTRFNLPLSVFSGDLRLDLVSQDLFKMFSTKPLTGGGMGIGEVNPSLRKEFRPVAYFNPSVVTDQDGRAKVEFKLPDTTTAYRVFAVVCDKGSGFVSGQRNMVVTKEFFIEPSLPRFFCPGDKAVFPVMLNNKTGGKGLATISAKGSEEVKLNLLESSARLEPWSTAVIKARTEITGGMEKGVFQFQGKFDGEAGKFDDAIELAVPIHSRFLPVKRVKIGDFSRKATIEVPLPQELKNLNPKDINADDFKAHLVLSAAPWARIAPGLKYLLNYPFGCVEQTSSGVIPLAALRGLIESGTLPGITVEQVDKFLKGGVDRLLSMQGQSGGFAYWPGQLDTSWWGSMYAVFALSLAKEAGFEVPEDRMNKALSFLRDGLFGKEGTDPYHGHRWTQEIALFNLSRAGMLTAQEMDPFFKNYNVLSTHSRALLLLAAKRANYLPQQKLAEMANHLDPKIDPGRIDYRNSSFREIAVCLMAILETGGAHQKADTWAGELIRGLKPNGIWNSTADTGWCLYALSNYYRTKKQGEPVKAAIKVQIQEEKPVEVMVTDASAYMSIDPRKLMDNGRITLESNAKTLINYTLNVTYPDLAGDPAKLSKGFSLNKKIENLSGKEEVRVGDVVRVTLEVRLYDPTSRYVRGEFEYVAIEDPVPAGLVPINSELKTEGATKEETGQAQKADDDASNDFTPSFFEFRNDGVRVFKNRAWAGSYRYSYLARAVAEGDFWMRGSRISLMYDPEVYGRTAGKLFKILPAGK